MNKIALTVTKRTETGKGPARRLRAAGKAPAVLYGNKKDAVGLAVDVRDLLKALEKAGSNPIFDLQIRDNGSTTTSRAILKERQVRPVDGSILHLDFLEILADQAIEVTVPLEFHGTPVGVEIGGGEFQIVTRELRVSCLPDDIPNLIAVDVSGLEIGKSLHLPDISLPAGVTALQDENTVLAAVAAPRKVEEAVVEEAAEPAAS